MRKVASWVTPTIAQGNEESFLWQMRSERKSLIEKPHPARKYISTTVVEIAGKKINNTDNNSLDKDHAKWNTGHRDECTTW